MCIKQIILLSTFIAIFSLINENQNINLTKIELEENYFINDMTETDFIKKNTEPFNNFFNLDFINNNNSYCQLIKTGIDILLNTIIQEYRWGYLHTFCSLVCSIELRRDICYAAVGRYGPIVIENTLKRILNSESICTTLHICKPSIEYESIEDYAKRILKTKVNSLQKNNKNNLDVNKKNKEFNFAQITDSHIQLDYQIGKVINCNIPLPYVVEILQNNLVLKIIKIMKEKK